MINASSARTGDLYMLNAANIRIYFVTAKKKREIFA